MDLKQTYVTVQPNLAKVNQFLSKTNQVAVTQVNPIFDPTDETHQTLQGLRLHLEGPKNQVHILSALLKSAGLLA